MSIRLAKTEIIRPLYQELREEEIAKQPTFQPGFKQESLFQRAIRRLRLLFQPNWKKQVSTLRNEVRTLSTERDRLIDDANSRFAVLELKLKESRDDLKLSKKQRNSLSKTNRRLSNQIDNFKKITKEAREEVETTEAEALEYRVGVGFLQAEIEEIRDEMEILEEQVREKHQLNTRIMEQLDGEIEKRSELTDELEKAKTENQVLKETILDDSVDDAKDMQYRKQISNLHKKYNEMESDRDEWKARHQNAAKDHRLSRQNLLDTNRDLERENAGLTADRHKLKQEAEAKNEEEGEFTNLLEALEQAEKDFARLYIFDEAKKSAKDSPFKNPQRAYDALEQMALTADEYIEERKGMSFLQSLQGVLSKRRVSVESPATMKKFNRKWKTVRGDNGKTVRVEMKNHYKLGNDFNNHQTCLRIYFILDEDSKKLCIGYCGKHPENYSTGKLS
jgi:chromosome segregation ATPase